MCRLSVRVSDLTGASDAGRSPTATPQTDANLAAITVAQRPRLAFLSAFRSLLHCVAPVDRRKPSHTLHNPTAPCQCIFRTPRSDRRLPPLTYTSQTRSWRARPPARSISWSATTSYVCYCHHRTRVSYWHDYNRLFHYINSITLKLACIHPSIKRLRPFDATNRSHYHPYRDHRGDRRLGSARSSRGHAES